MISGQSAAKKAAIIGLMGALTVALSLLEGLLPPLPSLPPGAKLGLANVIVLLAAWQAGLPSALLLALIKALAVLLSRGGTAALMSLSGGLLSAAMVSLLFALPSRPFRLGRGQHRRRDLSQPGSAFVQPTVDGYPRNMGLRPRAAAFCSAGWNFDRYDLSAPAAGFPALTHDRQPQESG